MIRIVLGNVGSGKTASIVRRIVLNHEKRNWYTNIQMYGVPQNKEIKAEMIVKKVLDDKGKETYKLNTEFWQELRKKESKLNVVLDEAHTLVDARRTQSKLNKVMSDFIALLRRVVGGADSGGGELVLITQLDRRIDVIAREMATNVDYHICHYHINCQECGASFYENNEYPDKHQYCPQCGSDNIKKENFVIQVFKFKNIKDYEMWFNYGMKKYYSKYMITDIDEYFDFYDTLQWDNLITEL